MREPFSCQAVFQRGSRLKDTNRLWYVSPLELQSHTNIHTHTPQLQTELESNYSINTTQKLSSYQHTAAYLQEHTPNTAFHHMDTQAKRYTHTYSFAHTLSISKACILAKSQCCTKINKQSHTCTHPLRQHAFISQVALPILIQASVMTNLWPYYWIHHISQGRWRKKHTFNPHWENANLRDNICSANLVWHAVHNTSVPIYVDLIYDDIPYKAMVKGNGYIIYTIMHFKYDTGRC